MDLLNYLPPEMVDEIFSKLSVNDLKTLRLVSNYYEILARRSLLKLSLISIDYETRIERVILNMDTCSTISPFFSSFLIESASLKISTNYISYCQKLCNFLRTKSTGFRHLSIRAFQLDHLENFMGPNVNFLTELKITVNTPFDKTLGNQNVFRFCSNLEKLSIMYTSCNCIRNTYYHYHHDDYDAVVGDIEFDELKNCLKNAPNLKNLELESSIEKNSSIPLFDLLINYPKLRTISLKFSTLGFGNVMINIKSYSNFEDIRIGVSTPASCEFAQTSESLKILNNFLKTTANFIINLSLTFSIRLNFRYYSNWEEEINEINLSLLELPLLPKCKQLTIDASSEYKFSSEFILNSSFPVLRKIVTKSSPNVLYCSSEIMSSVKYVEIWNGGEIETNSWATSFRNTTELIIKNPSYYFLSCLMRDKKIKEMKNLKILNLIDVGSSFFPTLSRKYGRVVRLQTLLQSEEGPVKKKVNQVVKSPYLTREMNVNENDIGPWSTLFSYFLTIITFLEL